MQKRILDLLQDSATYGISNVLAQITGFILLPFYTRYLSTEDYGVMAMFAVITVLFVPIGNLGLSNALFRQYNLGKDQEYLDQVTGTGLLSILANSLILLFIAQFFAENINNLLIGKHELLHLTRLTILNGFLMSIARVPQVILRSKRRVKSVAVLNVIKVLTTLSIIIYLILFRQMGLHGYVYGSFLGEVFYIILITLVTWKILSFKFSSSLLKSMFQYGFPFLPKQIQVLSLTFFSQYVVKELLGLEQLGLYSMALRFALPLNLVVMAIGKAWEPLKFQIKAESDDSASIFSGIVNYFLPMYFFVWIFISFWGEPLLKIMTTEEFHSAGNLIPVVTLNFLIIGIYQLLSTGMAFADNMLPLPFIQLAGTVTVIVSSYLLIPVTGALGAAIANILGWLAISILAVNVSQKRFKIDFDWQYLISISIVTCAFVGAGSYLQKLQPLLKFSSFAFLSLVFPVSMIFLLLHSKTESKRAHRALRRLWLGSGLSLSGRK